MRRLAALILVLGLAGCGASQPAATTTSTQLATNTGVRLRSIGRFDQPTYVTAPPGDRHRLFVVQREGSVVVLRDGRRAGTFLRVDTTTEGDRGLLSIAFASDYAQSGLVYAYYTASDGAIRVDEFHASPDADHVDAGSQRQVLSIVHRASIHNGGQLQFGPDGLLYAGVGDGGPERDARRNGQSLRTLFAKLLRIDPHPSGGRSYTVPADNPFVGRPGTRPEIYAYGLRNPWRFSFDRSNGAIAIGDVGQEAVEEIDYEPKGGAAGKNFGWSVLEGRVDFNAGSAEGAVPPVIQHSHASGWCSIVGGYVVRDASVPGLDGRYVYGDTCKPRLYAAKLHPGRATSDRPTALSVASLVSFGEDGVGHVYAVSLNGPIYRIDAR